MNVCRENWIHVSREFNITSFPVSSIQQSTHSYEMNLILFLSCLQDTDSLQSDHGIPNLSNGAGKIIAPKAAIYELDNFSQDTPQKELRRQKSGPSRQTSVDDLDKTSVYSFFMEKDFRYYFQHPYLRLAVAYLVTFCNFLIYAEDPVAHSEAECFIPVVGNTFSFVVTKYPKKRLGCSQGDYVADSNPRRHCCWKDVHSQSRLQ